MKTTVLKQGDVTYTRSHEYDNWESIEHGPQEGDIRRIDGVLHYVSLLGFETFGFFKKKRRVYWGKIHAYDLPVAAPTETPSKKARK